VWWTEAGVDGVIANRIAGSLWILFVGLIGWRYGRRLKEARERGSPVKGNEEESGGAIPDTEVGVLAIEAFLGVAAAVALFALLDWLY
jgi:hypothetical protein